MGSTRVSFAGEDVRIAPGMPGLLHKAALVFVVPVAFTAHAGSDTSRIDAAIWAVGGESDMRKFAIIVSIIVALVLVAIFGVWALFNFPTVTYRYRLTIGVEVGGHVHSASSVIEVKTVYFPPWAAGLANGNQLHRTDRGQAVLIDLGVRGVLVAALAGENYDRTSVNARELARRAFAPLLVMHPSSTPPARIAPRDDTGTPEALDKERAMSRMEGPADLTPDNMPAFFWFSDATVLATAKQVKPENFASVIGDSARLVSAQVEITHDPIVIDIDKKLPAYATLRGPPNDGNDYIVPGGLRLGWRQFISRGDE